MQYAWRSVLVPGLGYNGNMEKDKEDVHFPVGKELIWNYYFVLLTNLYYQGQKK